MKIPHTNAWSADINNVFRPHALCRPPSRLGFRSVRGEVQCLFTKREREREPVPRGIDPIQCSSAQEREQRRPFAAVQHRFVSGAGSGAGLLTCTWCAVCTWGACRGACCSPCYSCAVPARLARCRAETTTQPFFTATGTSSWRLDSLGSGADRLAHHLGLVEHRVVVRLD